MKEARLKKILLTHSYELKTKLIYSDKSQNSGYLLAKRDDYLSVKEHRKVFSNVGNILCLDQGDSYMSVLLCISSSSNTVKDSAFCCLFCYNIYQ